MKIPTFRRLVKSDYAKEFSGLIDTLSFTINNGVEVLYQALNKSLSLKDNIACTVKDVQVELKSDGTLRADVSFSLDTSNRVLGVIVLNAINTNNSTILPDSAPFIAFSQSGKTITISAVKGLPAGQKFNLTLVAFDS
ncbi:hypothetical protein EBZ38_06675 [bacterium]|nr:hypothetical protein [bacterium]